MKINQLTINDMETNYNTPAFPTTTDITNTPQLDTQSGMTLLDYFAAKAMQSLVYNTHLIGQNPFSIVEESYIIAAAMLEERKKYIK